MLLDSDKDIIESDYNKWYDRMYTSFTEQLNYQTTEYFLGLSEMVFAYDSEFLKYFLPFHATVYYCYSGKLNNCYGCELPIPFTIPISVDIFDISDDSIKKSVEEAMTTLVNTKINNKEFDYTKIEPYTKENYQTS